MNYKITQLISSLDSELNASNLYLDDTLLGCDYNQALGIFPSVDFTITDGAVWGTFRMIDTWVNTKDINLALTYNLNGVNNATNVTLHFSTWALDNGEVPLATPDTTLTETIVSSAANTGAITTANLAIAKIPLATMTATTKSLVIKIARDNTVTPNYTGTFQLVSLKAFQN